MQRLVSLAILALLCTAAGLASAQPVASGLEISGAKSGAYTSALLSGARGVDFAPGPSATVGVYSSLFLAQGTFLSANAAIIGMEAQARIISGYGDIETSETFVLLKELAAILQTNVAEMLDNSLDRTEALNTYLSSLENLLTTASRKLTELETLEDEQSDIAKEKRRAFHDLQNLVNRALRQDDYETAGANQEDLLIAEQELDIAESEQDQTQRVIRTYKKLIDVGEERLMAIEANREAIIAGIQVINLPGTDELDLIIDENRFNF
ncbi:MAG TPA: hypothetical protein VI913_04755 [Candidatus Peribacteraceae bacterium]|nr:hypothetical protein [Candidatus Peribacteraceae bacterium]